MGTLESILSQLDVLEPEIMVVNIQISNALAVSHKLEPVFILLILV